MAIKKTIPAITFNQHRYTQIEIEASAQKHFGAQSAEFFEKIASTLDGQTRLADEFNRSGEACFHVASCTSFAIDEKEYEYRDSLFKEHPDSETLRFFHGGQRRKKEYQRFPLKFKSRAPK